MYQSSAQLFNHFLQKKDITPQEFSTISGMPLTEVIGLLEGDIPVTTLRANHLAAAFDTDVEMWLDGKTLNAERVPC